MNEYPKPRWVETALWENLSPREKMYCGLRQSGLKENEMREKMQFRCGRTWRYFQGQIRKKIFG